MEIHSPNNIWPEWDFGNYIWPVLELINVQILGPNWGQIGANS